MKSETRLLAIAIVVFVLLLGIAIGRFGLGSGSTVPPAGRGTSSSNRMGGQVPVRPPSRDQALQQEQAIAALKDRVAADPTDRKGWVDLGHTYFDLARHDESIVAYDRALELDPADANVLTDQGVMFRRTQQFDKAIANFKKAREVDPTHMQSLFNLGIVYQHDMKDVAMAHATWSQYLHLEPNGPKTAQIQAELRRLEQASPSPIKP